MSERDETLPSEYYRPVSTLYETERRNIFARSWLLVGHESQLPDAGSYVAVTAAGYPIIVIKGDSGTVGAFHNVCRHRAGPLADDGLGKCEGHLVCRYHGWRYTLDGRLANARDFGTAPGFDPRAFGLFSIRCETWRGFIFVNMGNGADTLFASIAPLDARTRDLPLGDFRYHQHTSHDIRCNWKVYVENYLEGYHIPLVHPFLKSAVDAAKYEVDVSAPVIFHHAPPRDGSPVGGLWAWTWPCLGVNLYEDGVLMERMWPLSADVTRLDYLYFFRGGIERNVMERSIAASEITTAEDKAICEAVQRNLNAGIYETGRLSSKHEMGVRWFQQHWKEAVGMNGHE